MRSEVNAAPPTRGNMPAARSGGNANLTMVLRCDVAVVPISVEVVVRHIKSVFLVGLMADGLLSGCSDRDATTLPAEPEAAVRPAEDRLRRGVITLDVPGAVGTFALEINDAGVIVGRYRTSDGAVHGFLRRRSGEFVTIDFPGSVYTVATGINEEGDISGQYAPPEDLNARHGFLLRGRHFTTLDPPGSLFTNASGINDRGDITGRFFTADNKRLGFRLHRGAYTTIEFPGAVETNAWQSNNAGVILGLYIDADDRSRLFLARGGKLSALTLPIKNPLASENGDINFRGDVVATYCDESPCSWLSVGTHGLLMNSHGFTTIDVPGATSTAAIGMNELGDIVGGYLDEAAVFHGFLLPGGDLIH
jgi:uncharacterized membrane protein